MEIKIYNTLSREKETLVPSPKKPLRLFTCGPTVYDYPHSGNFRTYAFFDTLVRFLRSQGMKVFYLQNITDVDDKIINRSKQEKISWKTVARKYENIFRKNMKALNIISVDKFARATDFIPEIIKQVQTLIKKGFAYEIPGDGWYFDIKKFPDYGKLARRTVEQAEDGVSRIDENEKKRNRGDFCLWKLVKPASTAELRRPNAEIRRKEYIVIDGEPAWKTELGWGRPGWHIEDTAITEKFFGPQYDLHGGGTDLIFPHHEAEIAQQESASSKKPFVKIWMHVGFLTAAGGAKMSKSLKNFLSMEDYLKKHSPESFRLMILTHHYRSPLEWSEEAAESAENALNSIYEFLAKLDLLYATPKIPARLRLDEVQAGGRMQPNDPKKNVFRIEKYFKDFVAALSDDINTPEALASLFNLMNDANKIIWQFSPKTAKNIKIKLISALEILGIKLKPSKIPAKITALAKKRELLRFNKQFKQSDRLREKISGLGYRIEDTPLGALLLKKN